MVGWWWVLSHWMFHSKKLISGRVRTDQQLDTMQNQPVEFTATGCGNNQLPGCLKMALSHSWRWWCWASPTCNCCVSLNPGCKGAIARERPALCFCLWASQRQLVSHCRKINATWDGPFNLIQHNSLYILLLFCSPLQSLLLKPGVKCCLSSLYYNQIPCLNNYGL